MDKKSQAIAQQVRETLLAEMKELIRGEMREAIRDEMRRAIRDEMGEGMRQEMRQAIKEELQTELAPIRTQLNELLPMKKTVEDLKEAERFASTRIDDLYRVTIPAITAHMEKLKLLQSNYTISGELWYFSAFWGMGWVGVGG